MIDLGIKLDGIDALERAFAKYRDPKQPCALCGRADRHPLPGCTVRVVADERVPRGEMWFIQGAERHVIDLEPIRTGALVPWGGAW